MGILPHGEPPQTRKVLLVAKFTRMPKIQELVTSGVPHQAVGTLAALSDHANNRNGLCFPTMKRLSKILGCSTKTVSRHLHILEGCRAIEFVQRRRHKGRFSSFLYRVLHIVKTSGHQRPRKSKRIYKGTKNLRNSPIVPMETREEKAARRRESYEWLFDR